MIATGDTFTLMAAILAVAAGVGFVANRARQPLIVAFIAGGAHQMQIEHRRDRQRLRPLRAAPRRAARRPRHRPKPHAR